MWRRRFHSTGESALPSPEEEASTTSTFPNVEEEESGEDSSSCSSGHTSPHLSYCQEERTQVRGVLVQVWRWCAGAGVAIGVELVCRCT